MTKLKSYKKIEKIFKGLASAKRLLILNAISKSNGLILSEISEFLHINLKTAASHCQRLENAGLISKRKKGRKVIHNLTYLGRGMISIATRTKSLVDRL